LLLRDNLLPTAPSTTVKQRPATGKHSRNHSGERAARALTVCLFSDVLRLSWFTLGSPSGNLLARPAVSAFEQVGRRIWFGSQHFLVEQRPCRSVRTWSSSEAGRQLLPRGCNIRQVCNRLVGNGFNGGWNTKIESWPTTHHLLHRLMEPTPSQHPAVCLKATTTFSSSHHTAQVLAFSTCRRSNRMSTLSPRASRPPSFATWCG